MDIWSLIWTGVASSLIGAAAWFWFNDTKIGIWMIRTADNVLDRVARLFKLKALEYDPNAWKEQQPEIAQKIEELEKRLAQIEKSPH